MMMKKLALIALIAVLVVPAMADTPAADQNGTVDMNLPNPVDYGVTGDTGVTFTITAPTTGGTGGAALGTAGRAEAVVEPVELELDLTTAEGYITDAIALIESDPAAAAELLDSATTLQEGVNVILNTDLLELSTEIGVIEVEDLGISEANIEEGTEYMDEAAELIAAAEAETDLEARAGLLEDALELQRKAIALIPEVEKIAEDSDVADISAARVAKALKLAISDEAKAAIEAIAGDLPKKSSITIDRNFKTYQITNTEVSDDAAYLTKITLTLTAGEDLQEVTIVEVIPKSVAAKISRLIFKIQPVVLQADPIVQWTLKNLAEGATADISYIVKERVLSLDADTLAKVTVGEVEGPVAEIEGEIEIIAPEAPSAVSYGIVLLLVILFAAAVAYFKYPEKFKGIEASLRGKK